MNKLLLFLLALVSFNAYTLTPPFSQEVKAEESILNYDQSLGKFRDYTASEVRDYYSDLASKDGIKGDELLDNLQTIIADGHKKISNSDAWDSDWHYFLLLDRNYALDPLSQEEISSQEWKLEDVTVNPLYTDDIVFKKSDGYFDREHMWPKSRGFKDRYDTSEDLSEQPYAATDMHNLRMGESTNNQSGHNNNPYGEVADKNASNTTKIIDEITNEVTGYKGLNQDGITVYEPRDEDKGDIARGLFYMATRYHNYLDTETFQPALELVTTFNDSPTSTITCDSTKETPATYGVLADLIAWHHLDPVDEFEIHRNNLCYSFVQNNRNPYVDYPEWVNVAFASTDYGIDLDSPVGVKKEGLQISNLNEKFTKGDTLDLTTIKIEFINNNYEIITVDLHDENLSYEIYFNDKKLTITDDKITFDEKGTYKLKFVYLDDEGATYEYIIELEVKGTFWEEYGLYIIIGAASFIILLVFFIIIKSVKKKNKKSKKKKKKK